jgi:hypothetical protein
MTAQAILSDLQALGVRLEVHGDRLRYHPRSLVGPDLLIRLREHKPELLAILQAPAQDDPLFPPDLLAAMARAKVRWADAADATGLHHGRLHGGDDHDTPPGPDPRIIGEPVTLCPRCGSARVLPELRDLAGGLCWTCYAAHGRMQRPPGDGHTPRDPTRQRGL